MKSSCVFRSQIFPIPNASEKRFFYRIHVACAKCISGTRIQHFFALSFSAWSFWCHFFQNKSFDLNRLKFVHSKCLFIIKTNTKKNRLWWTFRVEKNDSSHRIWPKKKKQSRPQMRHKNKTFTLLSVCERQKTDKIKETFAHSIIVNAAIANRYKCST